MPSHYKELPQIRVSGIRLSSKDIIAEANKLLYEFGLKEWAKEMQERLNDAASTEEIFSIISDYVELI